jgi:DNA-binding NarL/FixJ family response regulator
MPIRVMLADDHPLVLDGIKKTLAGAEDIQVIAEATRGTDVASLVDKFKPDVLVLDMSLPGLDGVEITQSLKANDVNLKILALSGYTDRAYIIGTLEAGASGYLSKDESIEVIQEAIRGVAAGQQGWISRNARAVLVDAYQGEGIGLRKLTRREAQVGQLVIAGKTNHQIAAELQISEKTVEKYMQNLFEKCRVASRVELAVLLVRNDKGNRKPLLGKKDTPDNGQTDIAFKVV